LKSKAKSAYKVSDRQCVFSSFLLPQPFQVNRPSTPFPAHRLNTINPVDRPHPKNKRVLKYVLEASAEALALREHGGVAGHGEVCVTLPLSVLLLALSKTCHLTFEEPDRPLTSPLPLSFPLFTPVHYHLSFPVLPNRIQPQRTRSFRRYDERRCRSQLVSVVDG
jgi:hypothetical protein